MCFLCQTWHVWSNRWQYQCNIIEWVDTLSCPSSPGPSWWVPRDHTERWDIWLPKMEMTHEKCRKWSWFKRQECGYLWGWISYARIDVLEWHGMTRIQTKHHQIPPATLSCDVTTMAPGVIHGHLSRWFMSQWHVTHILSDMWHI